jgi:hypothetical protein
MAHGAGGDEVNSELQTSAHDDEAGLTEWQLDVERRFRIGDTQFGRIRQDVKAMRLELKANSEITGEIRDVVMAFAAFGRFCKRVGRVLAWIGRRLAGVGRLIFKVLKVGGALAASIGTIWAVIWAAMHGLPPPGEPREVAPGHEQPPQGRSPERPFSSTTRK